MKQKFKACKIISGIIFLLCLNLYSSAQVLLDPKLQPRFVNALPVPSVIDGRNGGLFTIGISQFDQWLGLIDPATKQKLFTTVWGYNGSYPGPTILAKKDMPIQIFWQNNLVNGMDQPIPHLLPIDPTIHWALQDYPGWQTLGVPVVTHLHGGHTESASDGLPDAWFTPHFAVKGAGFIKGETEPYYYGNTQQAGTLWYHDHALGITRLNVYAGLAGFYVNTDANEMNLQATGKLPASPYDIGLAIQDRMFTSEGKLFYPSQLEQEEQQGPSPTVLPEFFGDFILVNGMAWPVMEVEPRQYRFRILNGSDSRFYNLALSNGQPFYQVGTDDGFLNAPVSQQQILLGPGERRDIILDFSSPALWGQMVIVHNNAKTPYPKGKPVNSQTTGQIMAFKVTKPLNLNYPLTPMPSLLRTPIVALQTALPPRKLVLFEAEDEFDRLKPMLGTFENGVLQWHDPITENPKLNDTEIWEIYNNTMDAHPIHLHLVSTQLVNRQRFLADVDENGKPSNLRMIGQPKLPAPEERGWKDTWVMYPGEVTRVIANFDMEGLYVWHCHILSHEDHEMMRPYFVGTLPAQPFMKKTQPEAIDLETLWQVKVLPNPFSNVLTIELKLPLREQVTINLYDNKGRLLKNIYQGDPPTGLSRFAIDGSTLSNGIYYCEIAGKGQRILKKIVLQK
jgi:spore coat protein A, manganese oxidase